MRARGQRQGPAEGGAEDSASLTEPGPRWGWGGTEGLEQVLPVRGSKTVGASLPSRNLG